MKKSILVLAIVSIFFSTKLFSQDNIDYDLSADSKVTRFMPQSLPGPYIPNNNQGIQPPFVNTTSTTVLPNNLGSSQNPRAPMGGRRFIRTSYIISPTEMTASGFGAQLVSSIGWTYLVTNPQFGQNIPTTCDSVVIYLQNTTDATYLKGTSWTTIPTGMTKVYVGKYNIPSGIGPHYVDVNFGGTGTSPFSTIAGQGVYVAFEYTSSVANPIATTVASANITCNFGVANSIATGTNQTLHTNTLAFSTFRPETRFSAGKTYIDVASVSSLYTSGQSALCLTCPDSNRVTVLIDHLRAVSDNFTVKTRVVNIPGGSVQEEWTDNLSSATVSQQTIKHAWLKTGDTKSYDSIVVEILPAAGENVLYNNRTNIRTGYVKETTLNKWSYAIPTDTADGGFGVNGGSPARTANAFNALCTLSVYGVYYTFNRFDLLDNKPYHVEIYNDASGLPGTLIYNSVGLRVPTTNLGQVKVIHNLTTPLTVIGKYHVAIVQDSLINFGLGFQYEVPIRTGTFAFKNTTAIVWTDAGSAAAGGTFVFRPVVGVITSLNLESGINLEGFFNGTSQVADTVRLIAHNFSSPYAAVETAIGYVGTNSKGIFRFGKINNDSCYFFEARHRNHIATWSHQVCEKVDECDKLFDYRPSITQAFGSNMVFVAGPNAGYAFYGGDANQDDIVDVGDITIIFIDASNIVGGYVSTDCNGDDIVDVIDLTIAFNNATNFIGVVAP